MGLRFFAAAMLAMSCSTLSAQPPTNPQPRAAITIATWNLGWHLDQRLAERWINECSQSFAKDSLDGLWKPNQSGDKTGWQLRWGRDAPIVWDIAVLPPCDVYQANFKTVAVTAGAYRNRQQQIATLLAESVKADVIGFQEVSGAQAVREVLPDGGRDFEICSFEGFKVQRLAIAWRRSLGAAQACEVFAGLSLPDRSVKDQPRPGLALTLNVGGKRLRLLTVHLKSSCVSPLERSASGRGQLDGSEPNCQLLAAQVPALEAWIERQSVGVDALVILGDFNRNLQHEQREPADAIVRTPGQPSDALTPQTKVRNLWREVNDGVPASSAIALLDSRCEQTDGAAALCDAGQERLLTRDETMALSLTTALGCRNPIGLDHIALGQGVTATGPASKVSLGKLGRTLVATARHPDPLLALSDHCPLTARIELQ